MYEVRVIVRINAYDKKKVIVIERESSHACKDTSENERRKKDTSHGRV